MRTQLASYFKKAFFLCIFTGLGLAHAGSYEDFFRAIKQDNAARVQALLNRGFAQGESPLMMAAIKGQADIAEKLIARDADVNKTGWTPLHYAASSGQLAIITMLIEKSAYIDAESPNGTTPLMMAAMYGTPAAVKLLLQEGADTQLKNQQGLTALQFAQRAQREESIEAIAASIRSKRPAGQW